MFLSASNGLYIWSGIGARNSITAICIILLFDLFSATITKEKLFIWTSKFVLVMFFIAVSLSRSSIFIFIFILLPLYLVLRKKYISLVVLSVLGSFAALLLFDKVFRFLLRGQSIEDVERLSGRLDIWSMAVDVIKTSPIFGHGYYYGSSLIQQFDFYQSGLQSNMDNMFLDVAMGTGIIGVLLISASIISALWISLVHYKRIRAVASEYWSIYMQAIIVIIFTLFRSFLNPTIQSNHWNVLAFLISLVIVSKIKREKTKRLREANAI